MRNLFITSLILGLALFGVQASASANLLTDPGFDTQAPGVLSWTSSPWWGGGGGEMSGITPLAGGGGVITNTHALSPGQSGAMFMWDTAGGHWAYGMVAQTVNSITPGALYGLSASFLRDSDLATSEALLKVEWLNSLNAVIGSGEGATKFTNSNTINTWTPLSAQFAAPSGAAKAQYEVIYRKTAGAAPLGNVFVDNASFDVVPEPASLLLLGSGLVGLLGLGRKKRS